MSDAAIIGAQWNAHLDGQVTGVLTVTVDPGTFNRTSGKVEGRVTTSVTVKCMAPAANREWEPGGTVRRETMQTLVGQLPIGTPDPRQRDTITIGTKTWAILRIQPLTDGTTTFCWLLDLEACA